MHVYAQLYATKYPINESMFVNSPMAINRKCLLFNVCNSSKVKLLFQWYIDQNIHGINSNVRRIIVIKIVLLKYLYKGLKQSLSYKY